MGSIPDSQAMIAWLFKKQLLAAVDAEIAELSDDKGALTDEQREQKLAEIDRDILAVEREEEELVSMAESQGQTISRRTNSDPRAILGLASTMPNAKE